MRCQTPPAVEGVTRSLSSSREHAAAKGAMGKAHGLQESLLEETGLAKEKASKKPSEMLPPLAKTDRQGLTLKAPEGLLSHFRQCLSANCPVVKQGTRLSQEGRTLSEPSVSLELHSSSKLQCLSLQSALAVGQFKGSLHVCWQKAGIFPV